MNPANSSSGPPPPCQHEPLLNTQGDVIEGDDLESVTTMDSTQPPPHMGGSEHHDDVVVEADVEGGQDETSLQQQQQLQSSIAVPGAIVLTHDTHDVCETDSSMVVAADVEEKGVVQAVGGTTAAVPVKRGRGRPSKKQIAEQQKQLQVIPVAVEAEDDDDDVKLLVPVITSPSSATRTGAKKPTGAKQNQIKAGDHGHLGGGGKKATTATKQTPPPAAAEDSDDDVVVMSAQEAAARTTPGKVKGGATEFSPSGRPSGGGGGGGRSSTRLERAQGQLTKFTLKDIAVHNPKLMTSETDEEGGSSHRTHIPVATKQQQLRAAMVALSDSNHPLSEQQLNQLNEVPLNDYMVANVIRIARGSFSQFAYTWKTKVKPPPLTSDCCMTFSTISCAILSTLYSQDLRPLSSPSAQNYILFLAVWMHQLTKPEWSGPTKKKRPVVADVARVLMLNQFFNVVAGSFFPLYYNQEEKAMDYLRRLIDPSLSVDGQHLDQHHHHHGSSSSASSYKLCGYVIVSGDYAVSVVVVEHAKVSTSGNKGDQQQGATAVTGHNPNHPPKAWTLCLCDSHGTLFWAKEAVCTTRITLCSEDVDPAIRHGSFPIEEGLRHFSNILFALLEDCRRRNNASSSSKMVTAEDVELIFSHQHRRMPTRGAAKKKEELLLAAKERTTTTKKKDAPTKVDDETQDAATTAKVRVDYMTWVPILRASDAPKFSVEQLGSVLQNQWLDAVLTQSKEVKAEAKNFNFDQIKPSTAFFGAHELLSRQHGGGSGTAPTPQQQQPPQKEKKLKFKLVRVEVGPDGQERILGEEGNNVKLLDAVSSSSAATAAAPAPKSAPSSIKIGKQPLNPAAPKKAPPAASAEGESTTATAAAPPAAAPKKKGRPPKKVEQPLPSGTAAAAPSVPPSKGKDATAAADALVVEKKAEGDVSAAKKKPGRPPKKVPSTTTAPADSSEEQAAGEVNSTTAAPAAPSSGKGKKKAPGGKKGKAAAPKGPQQAKFDFSAFSKATSKTKDSHIAAQPAKTTVPAAVPPPNATIASSLLAATATTTAAAAADNATSSSKRKRDAYESPAAQKQQGPLPPPVPVVAAAAAVTPQRTTLADLAYDADAPTQEAIPLSTPPQAGGKGGEAEVQQQGQMLREPTEEELPLNMMPIRTPAGKRKV